MAQATLTIYSRALNKDTTINLLLPERRLEWPVRETEKHPVLYMLHGHCQDHTSWIRSSRIEWYLRQSSLIAVFPDGDRSFYVDGVCTHRYQTFLTEELPIILENYFPVSTRREDTFIAGQSMGGYGCLNIALNHPDRYYGVIAMAPAARIMFAKMDQKEVSAKGGPPVDDPDNEANIRGVFGDEEHFLNSDYDLYHVLESRAQKKNPQQDIYLCCGTEDFLHESTLKLSKTLSADPSIRLTYEEWQGIHDWDFWDQAIVKGLKHFGLISPDYVRK